jgi:hypothetical protein
MTAGLQGTILIVGHGPGRGRSVPTGDVFFARLQRTDPELASRVAFYATGGLLPSLNGVALVVFWLGDPLRQKYPSCYAEAIDIASAAARRGIAIINSPQGLSNTSKGRQAELWTKAGIPSADARCIATARDLPTVFASLGGPCLLRGDETHADRTIRVLKTQVDADLATVSLAPPAALIRVHDIRAEYRAAGADPSSLYARFHHKARAFVFRGEVKASHLFFGREIAVGLSNCLFVREARPRRKLLRLFGFRRRLFDDMIAEDIAYFNSSLPYKEVLVKGVAALGLDVAAVDYSIRPDGTPILWEANPYFWLPRGEESVLSAERLAVGRVNASIDWLANCLRAALPERMAS